MVATSRVCPPLLAHPIPGVCPSLRVYPLVEEFAAPGVHLQCLPLQECVHM